MCLLMGVSAVCCKKCGCQWHLFGSVQWLNTLWRRNSWSAIVYSLGPPVSEGGWHETEMNMTYVPEHACQDMIHAAHTVTYNMANDDESFNKEMASDSLEWYVMQSPNKKTWVVLLASRDVKVCELHIGWFAVKSGNLEHSFLCWHDVWIVMSN